MSKRHGDYWVNFLEIDPDMPWSCDTPIHGENLLPKAVALCLITLAKAETVVVNQASYVCEACKVQMQSDMETEKWALTFMDGPNTD